MNANVKPGVHYNFSNRQRAVAKLPPKAQEKLAYLRETQMRVTAMKDGIASQLENARTNFNEARTSLVKFESEFGATYISIEEVGERDQDGKKKRVRIEREREEHKPLVAEVERWKGELARLSDQLNSLHSGFSVDTLLDEIGAMEGKLVSVPPPKISEKGSPKEMLASLREKESATEASIEEIDNAPCLPSEAKAKLRAEIDVLAAQGAPEVTHLFRSGSVVWPEQMVVSNGAGVHQFATVSNQRDAFSLLVWLNKDAILKRLEEEIDFEADGANALSAGDCQERCVSRFL